MKLHAYQERAVQFGLENKQTFMAIDMGLGKTAIALTMIGRLKIKAFVFAPLRVIANSWPEEIHKWTPHLSYAILHGSNKSLRGLEEIDILLMNYEGLKWLSQQRGPWTRRMVIYDESSMAKSPSTSRFKLLRSMQTLWQEYKLCLSATPAPNSLSDLWSQYYLLDQGRALGKNITTFRKQYCSSYSFPGMSVTLYKVIESMHQQIYDRVAPITFRLEDKDHLELPEITYNQISVTLPEALQKHYKSLEDEFVLELEADHVDIEAPNKAVAVAKLRQFVQGGLYDETGKWRVLHNEKLKALKEILASAAGQSVLCPIQFKGELRVIQKTLPKTPVIAGGTPFKESQRLIREWNKGNLSLLLCHPASVSHGLNLQSGGHIIVWYGLPWSLEHWLQLIGRLHRQGQRNAVVVHSLVMRNTVDEAVIQALTTKDMMQNKFLDYIKKFHA